MSEWPKTAGDMGRDGMRAEIERLQELHANAVDEVDEWRGRCAQNHAEIERLKAYQNETAKAWTKLTESQEAEIEQLKEAGQSFQAEAGRQCALRKQAEAEIERLNELLRGVGANRYWEGRWRDAQAENARLLEAVANLLAAQRQD